jgi:hypothetical protein
MTSQRFDKSKLPSRHVTEGPSRAPHRSYLYAMGITEEEIHQPWVGVATCWNEAAPCNITLSRQAQAAKKGVAAAGGTPREFTTITVTDGIAMGHAGMHSSLASREVIADSVELSVRAHCYDALVGIDRIDAVLDDFDTMALGQVVIGGRDFRDGFATANDEVGHWARNEGIAWLDQGDLDLVFRPHTQVLGGRGTRVTPADDHHFGATATTHGGTTGNQSHGTQSGACL